MEEASQTTTMTRRKLAENSRVLCGWHDDAWSDDEALEWYPGCATPSDPMDAACDVYDVVFDDGDGRERVKREELRSVFVPGAFDWASPFVEEDDEVEEEAVEVEDFPLLSSDDGARSWRRCGCRRRLRRRALGCEDATSTRGPRSGSMVVWWASLAGAGAACCC